MPIKSGETFNGEKVEKTVEAITFATGSTGYAFVDVNPRLDRNPETRTVDITFEVNEGPRVYVERVNITGNTRTLDKVIRREVRIAEGDPFNRVLVDRSKARIKSLDYFKEVEIEEKPGSAPDRTELDVKVEEKSTGSFSVGVGVSSTENFIVDLSISEKNLMGKGQLLVFRVQASSRTRQVDIRFTQPYFLDRNLTAGFSLFNQRTNFRNPASSATASASASTPVSRFRNTAAVRCNTCSRMTRLRSTRRRSSALRRALIFQRFSSRASRLAFSTATMTAYRISTY